MYIGAQMRIMPVCCIYTLTVTRQIPTAGSEFYYCQSHNN